MGVRKENEAHIFNFFNLRSDRKYKLTGEKDMERPAGMKAAISSSLEDIREKAENCYEDGKYDEALKWYRKLAVKGDDTAIKMVASCEENLSKMRLSASATVAQITTPQPPSPPAAVMTPSPLEKKREPRVPEAKMPPISAVPQSFMEVSYSTLTFEQELGRGGFGIVYRGQWQHTTVAIKKLLINTLTEDTLTEFTQEAQLMSQLRHPNVVNFYKICTEPSRYCIVME